MSPKPKEPSRAESPDRWVISYADLLTLMLAFFVVLYAQSTVNEAKLKRVATAIVIAFHGNPSVLLSNQSGESGVLKHFRSAVPMTRPAPGAGITRHELQGLTARAGALRLAEGKLARLLMPLVKKGEVKLESGPLSLRISLNSRILFKNGAATLQPAARTLLSRVAAVIRGVPADYPVVIQGYTNKIPIATPRFPSNWELSAARAISVVHLFMRDQIPGKQLSVQGFSQYHPLHTNSAAEALQKNRRVEIVILAPSLANVGGEDTGPTTLAVPVAPRAGPPGEPAAGTPTGKN